tara:strand:- start:100 stop:1212 length:1113 start_codon:yes stop_codon:yes gene_type:complete
MYVGVALIAGLVFRDQKVAEAQVSLTKGFAPKISNHQSELPISNECSEGYIPDCNNATDCIPTKWVGDGFPHCGQELRFAGLNISDLGCYTKKNGEVVKVVPGEVSLADGGDCEMYSDCGKNNILEFTDAINLDDVRGGTCPFRSEPINATDYHHLLSEFNGDQIKASDCIGINETRPTYAPNVIKEIHTSSNSWTVTVPIKQDKGIQVMIDKSSTYQIFRENGDKVLEYRDEETKIPIAIINEMPGTNVSMNNSTNVTLKKISLKTPYPKNNRYSETNSWKIDGENFIFPWYNYGFLKGLIFANDAFDAIVSGGLIRIIGTGATNMTIFERNIANDLYIDKQCVNNTKLTDDDNWVLPETEVTLNGIDG